MSLEGEGTGGIHCLCGIRHGLEGDHWVFGAVVGWEGGFASVEDGLDYQPCVVPKRWVGNVGVNGSAVKDWVGFVFLVGMLVDW